MAEEGSVGDTARLHVEWIATGTYIGDHTFYVLGALGDAAGTTPGDGVTLSFGISRYVSAFIGASVGENFDTTFDFLLGPSDVGTWDIYGLIGDAASAAYSSVYMIYAERENIGALNVSHVTGAAISNVWVEII